MFFNGMIRLYNDIDAKDLADYANDYIKNHMLSRDLKSTISLFNDSQWVLIERSYKDPTKSYMYLPPVKAYYDAVEKLLAQIGNNYYVVQSMIAWVPPGSEISKHVDLQKIYSVTRRLHLQLLQNDQAYMSTYSDDRENQFNFKPGTAYELNNRIYHSVKNNSPSDYYAILVVDIAENEQKFTEQDNVDKDKNIPSSKDLPLYSYH